MSALKKGGVARVLYGMLVGLQVAMVRGLILVFRLG